MRKEKRDDLLGWSFYVLTIVVVFLSVYFMGRERHDPEEDLKLIEKDDLVMCTAEKLPINVPEKGTSVHIVAAMSVTENSVESREIHGWILNNDAVVNGVVGYEELHQNCDGEVIFAEAGSEKARDIASGITTKGLPLEIVYTPTPPLPTQYF
jgi:hypothetical protein